MTAIRWHWLYGIALSLVLFTSLAAVRVITPYMLIASMAYTLMLTGFRLRRENQTLHISFMLAAIALDLTLVLILQIQRDAVHAAIHGQYSILQRSHIATSLVATLLYFPMLGLGYLNTRPKASPQRLKTLHKWLGIACFTFRTLGFFLMFSLIGKH